MAAAPTSRSAIRRSTSDTWRFAEDIRPPDAFALQFGPVEPGPVEVVPIPRAIAGLELVGGALEALAGGDAERLLPICAPDVHVRTPALEHTSRAAVSEALAELPRAFSGIVVSVESLIVSDRMMAAEWRIRARHSADLAVDWALIEATGQAVTLEGALTAHLCENVDDGTRPLVFDDIHLHYDTTSLLVQLALA